MRISFQCFGGLLIQCWWLQFKKELCGRLPGGICRNVQMSSSCELFWMNGISLCWYLHDVQAECITLRNYFEPEEEKNGLKYYGRCSAFNTSSVSFFCADPKPSPSYYPCLPTVCVRGGSNRVYMLSCFWREKSTKGYFLQKNIFKINMQKHFSDQNFTCALIVKKKR